MSFLSIFTYIQMISTIIISFSLLETVQAKILFKKAFSATVNPKSILNYTSEKAVKVLNEKLIDNFYTVQKNKLYRSAQLSPDRLEHYIRKYRIKTIINLRGEHLDQDWWQAEAAVAQRNGIQLFNIAMSANELTPKWKLLKLLEIYDAAPTPILIHCLHGKDRTGEAAAIWVCEKMNGGNRKALRQLLLVPYQHIQARYPAKRFLIRIWNGRDWLMNEYDPTKYLCR